MIKNIHHYIWRIVIAAAVLWGLQGCAGEPGALVDGKWVTATISGSPSCSDTAQGVVQTVLKDIPVSFGDSSVYGRFQDPYPTWDMDGDGDVDYAKSSISHRFSSGGMHKVVFCIDEKREQCMDIWLCVVAPEASGQTDQNSSSSLESIQGILDALEAEVAQLVAIANQLNTQSRDLRKRVREYQQKVRSLLDDVNNLKANIYLIQGTDDLRIVDAKSRLQNLMDELVDLDSDLENYARNRQPPAPTPIPNPAPPQTLPPTEPPPSVCTMASLIGSSTSVGQRVDNSSCECDGGTPRMISDATLKFEPKRCLKLSECRVMVSDNGTVKIKVKGPGGRLIVTESFFVNKGCSQLRFDDISQVVLNKDVAYEIEITAEGGGLKLTDFSGCSAYSSQYVSISARNNPLGNLVIKY